MLGVYSTVKFQEGLSEKENTVLRLISRILEKRRRRLISQQRQQLLALLPGETGGTRIEINAAGQTEYVRYDLVEDAKRPVVRLQRAVLATHNFDALLSDLANAWKQSADQIRQLVVERLATTMRQTDQALYQAAAPIIGGNIVAATQQILQTYEQDAQRDLHNTPVTETFAAYTTPVLDQFREQIYGTCLQLIALEFHQNLKAEISRLAGAFWSAETTEMQIYPKNSVICQRKGSCMIYVIQEDPGIRRIFLNDSMLNSHHVPSDFFAEVRRNGLALALPYIIFVVSISKTSTPLLRVFFRNTPITSQHNILCACPLPNTATSGQVCLGTFTCLGPQPSDRASNAIKRYWTSIGNSSAECYAEIAKLDSRLANFWAWHEASMIDPEFPLRIAWPEAMTVEQAIKQEFLDRGLNSSEYSMQLNAALVAARQRFGAALKEKLASVCRSEHAVKKSLRKAYRNARSAEIIHIARALQEQIAHIADTAASQESRELARVWLEALAALCSSAFCEAQQQTQSPIATFRQFYDALKEGRP